MRLTAYLGAPLAAFSLVAVVAGAHVAAVMAPVAENQPAVSLFASDGGKPLFTVANMLPGDTKTACVDVSVQNADRGDTVEFGGENISGPLADFLQVTVLAGPTSGADCDAFTGTKIYDSTLSGLATASAGTGWLPASGAASWRFRISVHASPQAPYAATASAAFDWRFDSAALAPPVPTPAAIVPPASPAPSGPAPTKHHSSPPPPTVTLSKSQPPWYLRGVTATGEIARSLLQHPQYPIGLVVLALLFLAAQEVVDRRDPKLAIAPVRNDDLHFTMQPTEVQL